MDKVITYSFCQDFIKCLAGHIKAQYKNESKDLSRIGIVFGGKRPALFLKRELSRLIKTSYFPPEFFTIDHLIHYIIRKEEQFTPINDLDSCYLIYQIIKEEMPHLLHGRQSFAEFLPWSRELLRFIDQIDLENVSDKSLTNLEEIAKIGFSIPDEINQLLENIVQLRLTYHKQLRDQKTYSRGYQYLRAAQLIENQNFAEFDQILFCNFFYFNRAEEVIIDSLHRKGKSTFIFQGDQRRWPILNRLAKKHSWEIKEGAQVDEPKFKLKLHAGYDVHSQIGVIRKILENTKAPQNSVIVLPNPDHIVPLLSEITSQVKEFNISMGYPLKRSSLYTLFDMIFRAQLSRKNRQYYARDYLKVLLHPFAKNMQISLSGHHTRNLIHKIEEILTGKVKSSITGSLFIKLQEIESLDDITSIVQKLCEREGLTTNRGQILRDIIYLHDLFFKQWESLDNFDEFADKLNYFLRELVDKSILKNYSLNLNIAHKIFQIHDELKCSTFAKERFPQEEIFKVFERKISSEIVSFIGSPLKGLQLLGLFETRSLNFDQVIVVDVNEGVLPNLDIYEPLIPRDVMISLGLNRVELDEEIQRYQFMRLISSAKDVHLIYQQNKEKEKSRFVEELIWEQQKRDNELDDIQVVKPQFNVKSSLQVREVKKTPEVIKMLKSHCYSASSINTYLRNPMEFYHQYVLGLREQEDLLDEPEARHIGTFVHGFLEESFRPFLNRKPDIDKEFIADFVKKFEKKFDDTFARSMKSDAFLLRSVIKERMLRFIENERQGADRQIKELLYLESRFEDIIPLSCGDIRFSYIIDRIERQEDDTIMVIDYKTGSVNPMPKDIHIVSSMELNRDAILENVKSFQIPLYFYFLEKEFKGESINAALYNLRTLKLDKFVNQKNTHSVTEINQTFLRVLDYIMCEILNPKVNFVDESQVLMH